MTATALTESGLSKQPKALIYGLGALPVLRLALADAKKFDAFLLNALAQLELTWEAKRAEGHVVRLAELDPAAKGADANPPVVMMQLYHGGDCVVSIAHPAEVGARVQAITGQVKPARPWLPAHGLRASLSKTPTPRRRATGSGRSTYTASRRF